jgi:hypothetical protein
MRSSNRVKPSTLVVMTVEYDLVSDPPLEHELRETA